LLFDLGIYNYLSFYRLSNSTKVIIVNANIVKMIFIVLYPIMGF